MIATVLSDIALNVGAAAALVAAAGVATTARRARRIEAKVGAATVTLDGIDRVVNQQPKHAPTIPRRLEDIDAKLERVTEDVLDLHSRHDTITARFDTLEALILPTPPPETP